MLYLMLKLLLAIAVSQVAGDKVITCYGYDGTPYANNTRCPGSNTCCGTGATCLSNRLCHNPNDGPNTFVRGPCAINPYDSGTCSQICLYDEGGGLLPRVTICADGSLCCNNDNHCCDDGKGIFLDENGLISDKPPEEVFSYGPERTATDFRMSTPAPSPTSTESSTSTTSPTESTSTPVESEDGKSPVESEGSQPPAASEESSSSGNGSNDQAMKIGVGVGVPVGALLIGLCAFLLWKMRRDKARSAAAANGSYQDDIVQFQQKPPKPEETFRPHYELSAEHRPAELEGHPRV